jgi:hypothetical protein
MHFKFYVDPGHGWLAVKRNLLAKYVEFSHISPYSYQKGSTVYLEEDRDASVFLEALRRAGVVFSFTEKHTDRLHPIRTYDSFTA